MNDEEMKYKIVEGISLQTGLSLRIVKGYDNNIKLCLEDEGEQYWKYTMPIPSDCNVAFFIKQIGDLLQDYLFFIKLKENDE